MLGLETELAARTEDDRARRSGCTAWSPRSTRTWRPTVCIKGAGGGDGGLFNGITAALPGAGRHHAARTTRRGRRGRATPRSTIVLKSAQSAWDYRQTVDGLPLFGPFWDRNAELPDGRRRRTPQFVEGAVNASEIPERDLSVQLSGWMLMEAAHAIAANGESNPDTEEGTSE